MMMESHLQSQEGWNNAGDKLVVTLPNPAPESQGQNMAGDRGQARQDGLSASSETVLETAGTKNATGKDSMVHQIPALVENPLENQPSAVTGSAESSAHAATVNSISVKPVEDVERGLSWTQTSSNLKTEALSSSEDVKQAIDVTASDGQVAERGQEGKGTCGDTLSREAMEVEVSGGGERKEGQNSVSETQGEERETDVASPKSQDMEVSEEVASDPVSNVDGNADVQQVDTTVIKDNGSKSITESGDVEGSGSSSHSCPETAEAASPDARCMENRVCMEDNSAGADENSTTDKEGQSLVSDRKTVSWEEGQRVPTQESEESVSLSAPSTEAGPQPYDITNITPPSKAPPGNTHRTNIFERFSSDLPTDDCVPSEINSDHPVEKKGYVCGESSQFEPLGNHEDGEGDGMHSQDRARDSLSETAVHHQTSSPQQDEGSKEPAADTLDPDSPVENEQQTADCSRSEVDSNGKAATKDALIRTQTVADEIDRGASQKTTAGSPEDFEATEQETDNIGDERLDAEVSQDTDSASRTTERGHFGKAPSPAPTKLDAVVSETEGSGLVRSGERVKAKDKDMGSEGVNSFDGSSQKMEVENTVDSVSLGAVSKVESGSVKEMASCDLSEPASRDLSEPVSEDSRDKSSLNQHQADKHMPEKAPVATHAGFTAGCSRNSNEKSEDSNEEVDNGNLENNEDEKDRMIFLQNGEDSREGHLDSDEESKEMAKMHSDSDKDIENFTQDNESDMEKSASDLDDSPDTPQFRLARTKTIKTYSRKSESNPPYSPPGTTGTGTSSEPATETQPALTDPDHSDLADSEESSSVESHCASPIIESAHSDSNEGSTIMAVAPGSKDPSLSHLENQFNETPPPAKTSIISRITKAVTSVPRDQDRGRTATRAFVMKLKPMVKASARTVNESHRNLDDDATDRSKGKTPLHTCDLCGKTFLMPARLKRHQLHHQAGKHFCCDVCGKSFVDQEKLDFHHKVHTGDGDFSCDQCGQTCKNWRSYVYHMQTHGNNGGKKYSCELCGHTLSSLQRLDRHMTHHKKGFNFCCFGCGKLFKTQEDLDRHSVKHSKLTATPVLPVSIPKPLRITMPSSPTSAVHSTPVRRKRAAGEPKDRDQPLVKRGTASRATRQQMSGTENGDATPPANPQSQELSENDDDGESQRGNKTSGTSSPARDSSSSISDVGKIRKSSRKRSHSRKMCSCCPSSPTKATSPSSSPPKSSKVDSVKKLKQEAECSPEKKRKLLSEAAVMLEQCEKKGESVLKKSGREDDSDRKKVEMFHGDLALRECSIKLERSSSASPQKVSPSPERVLQTPPNPTSPKASETLAADDKKPDLISFHRSPATEESGQKCVSNTTPKVASGRSKRPASDPPGGRKVKIYRTASEKMLPKNLALSNASRERARKAAKEKQTRAANAEKSEARAQKTVPFHSSPSTSSNTRYPCPMCGGSFRSDSDMKIHMSRHLMRASPKQQVDIETVAQSCRLSCSRGSPDKEGYVCHRCGFSFQSYADLSKHMWIHSLKPYQCPECCLAFTFLDTLQRHMQVHKTKSTTSKK